MFQHVERADAGKVLIGEGQPGAAIKLTAVGEFSGPLDVRLRDVHAISFVAGLRQAGNDLPNAAAHVEHAVAGAGRFQCVGILGIKAGIPVRQKPRIRFVVAIRLLMAHRATFCGLELGAVSGAGAEGLRLSTSSTPQSAKASAVAARLT